MWEVTYTPEGIEVRFDDGNDVWLKTITYEEIRQGQVNVVSKLITKNFFGRKTKEDNSNGTH